MIMLHLQDSSSSLELVAADLVKSVFTKLDKEQDTAPLPEVQGPDSTDTAADEEVSKNRQNGQPNKADRHID